MRCLSRRSATVLALLACAITTFAKKDEPTISTTKFNNTLANVFYFDDSNTIIGQEQDAGTAWISHDAGESWKVIDDDKQAGAVSDIWPHPYDNQRAYIIGESKTHWVTTDQGKSWRRFDSGSAASLTRGSPLSFHGRDPSKVIWNGENCLTIIGPCESVASYTDDDFKHVTAFTSGTDGGCNWAVATPEFAEEIAPEIRNRVMCIRKGLFGSSAKNYRLTMSDDFFEKHDGVEPALDGERAVSGIVSMASVKKFVVVAAKSAGTDELALFVTKDTVTWHRAEFGQHRVAEDAYTILESTNYSLQVDVLGSRAWNPMGHLFTSNSNGTYFTKNLDYTNRNILGRVDFEKVSGIKGIILVNTVNNYKEVDASSKAVKNVVSMISFDDGRTFQEIRAGDQQLHLHSVTEAKQGGRMFSSPAPGIVMGVGNVGKYLKEYEHGDLYVSDDAGISWKKALSGAHMYEFGNNGAVLAAVDNEEATDHIRYSLDHGITWEKAKLDKKIRAKYLTTVPDSTTLKFLLGGVHGTGGDAEFYVSKIDFAGLHERTCKDSDFEDWSAHTDKQGQDTCIMGSSQHYRRRKAKADCFIDADFKDPKPIYEPCECVEADFECDFNFRRSEDRKECIPTDAITVPKDVCKNPEDTFKSSSGWRKIPGNHCKGGVNLEKEVDRPCSDTAKNPSHDGITSEKTLFDASSFSEWHYLEHGTLDQGKDETIVMRTSEHEIYITHNHGKEWARILEKEPIVAIIPHPNYHNAIYFLTGKETVHYTIDWGTKFASFSAPKSPTRDGVPVLKFHPNHKDWLLWAGQDRGRTNIYYTKSRGDKWDTLVRAARRCDYVSRKDRDELIFCEQFEDENPDTKVLTLVSSDNFFAESKVHYKDILAFATMSEYIIVAQRSEDRKTLQVDASVDGATFAPAEFPKNFHVEHQQAYTIMDSSTHAVFLHVTVNPQQDSEYGTIIKSNSNGTNYVKVLDFVNRDTPGYVDFEKMPLLEGVALVNVVANPKEVDNGSKKVLKSLISHNDGADWAPLPPPKDRAEGGTYSCVGASGKATPECSLHIHSYTERQDKTATFGSPTAIGLMIAVGNVGSSLLRKDDAQTDTFLTADAGITWKSVKRGSYLWQYGDQGSIIVIVLEDEPTRSIFYSLNEGDSWVEYEFSPGVDMRISSVTTVPSDNSRNFVLWGREVGANNKKGVMTVNIDFTGLPERSRKCVLDEMHPDQSRDYYLWEPKHPFQQENCLFGHVAQYRRKKKDADCYIGHQYEQGPHAVLRNCSCTREDFECDFNFQKAGDGTCVLVEGYNPPDHQQACREDPNLVEWYGVSGYRKVPLSTCQGGAELDKLDVRPCPGHEKDFEERHGSSLGGFGLFVVVIVALGAASAIGYWVYDRYSKQGLGFGAIRLGESLGSTSQSPGSIFRGPSGESPLITIPVAIIAGTWAVAKALPLLVSSLWRSAKGYIPLDRGGVGPYRTRDSFVNRRGQYANAASVEDDELLGEADEADDV